ncbi:hypothetical protein PILCRDRAFT_902 [Piloderma croceum F 1598]|uniref:RING-type domain-containing protein n=1 Tax=Piloderma croceum (strain F 1598) TaxID=765440 RepID=A0A0C3CQ43_PILCF|nr:hypothetical protein PILCRDRAFT_902 [Piloderma croceum F 1598]
MAQGTGRQRGRGGHRRRGSSRGVSKSQVTSVGAAAAATISAEEKPQNPAEAKAAEAPGNENEVCWICAEPVKYYSVSDCDHRTCHVCTLRLRALYKNTDCTFCKAPQPTVIFTVSPDAEFLSYTPNGIPYKDSKLGIFFETEAMMEETLILLCFNCPDPSCDYIGVGWGDLKLHVRAMHGRVMCDLCIRFKKVFSHEHALYPANILPLHLPSIPHRLQKSIPVEQIEGGIHPLCQCCRECFFSDDELYTHMQERHEECFVCKRMEIRDQYFKDYDSLEKHFTHAHHPCTQPQCQARKFVVFSSALDLKAHMVDEHGADMTSRDKKDARRIQADFEFDEVGVGGRRSRRDRGGQTVVAGKVLVQI